MGLGRRARDHGRVEMFNAKCAKCGKMTQVPWDPKTDTSGRTPMCRDCRDFYAP